MHPASMNLGVAKTKTRLDCSEGAVEILPLTSRNRNTKKNKVRCTSFELFDTRFVHIENMQGPSIPPKEKRLEWSPKAPMESQRVSIPSRYRVFTRETLHSSSLTKIFSLES